MKKIEEIIDNHSVYFGSIGDRESFKNEIESLLEEMFNAGFDEGYTNPMERDGKLITEKEYIEERKKNYQNYLKQKA